MDSRLTNLSSTALTNVRMWLGTGDDFIGESDRNYKIKGNITAGAFVPLAGSNNASNALMVTETSSTTSGSAVLFYSTTAGVDTVHTRCCNFSNAINQDPRGVAVTSGQTDGSYAMFLRAADLAPGQSGGLSVYYAAAPVAQLNDAIVSVDNAAGNASKPVYVRLTPGSSVYGDVPVFNYALYDALSGGLLITDASASGSVSWLGAPTATSSAGVYTIQYDTGLVLGKAGYTLTPGGPVYWTVTPRALNVAVTKTYDGSTTFNAGFVLSGLVNGDSAPAVTGSASVSGRNAGRYSSFDSSTLSLSNANYVLNTSGISASIDARPVTVTADAKSKVYGNVDPGLTYQVSKGELVAGDSLAGVLRRAAGENVGSYTIDASALANGNYVVTAQNGNLTIDADPALENAIRLARRQITTGTNDVAAGTTASAIDLAVPGIASVVPGANSVPDGGISLIGGLALVPWVEAAQSAPEATGTAPDTLLAALPASGGSGMSGFTRIFVINGGINVAPAVPVSEGVAQ
ncbi:MULTISPECIES: MBG domain-containing protein [unclassified Janthinobacterium]